MSKTEEVRAGKPRRTSVVTSRAKAGWCDGGVRLDAPRLPHTLFGVIRVGG